MIHAVIRTSRSSEPSVELFAKKKAAENHMAIILAEGGWQIAKAREAAAAGKPVLIRDDGDGDTIGMRHLMVRM
jgi:hypothetical protein